MKLRLFIAGVFLIECVVQSFAADVDRAAATLHRELGVTIAGGDGSSFEKAILVRAPNLETATVAEYEYIALRYRLWQFERVEILRSKGKVYNVWTFYDPIHYRSVSDWKKRPFYFDMSGYAPTHSVAPEYPREARDKGVTGKGTAAVKVDPATGQVTSVSIIKSTGHDILDNSVVRAVRQWRYRPRGITSAEIPIQFTAKGVIY